MFPLPGALLLPRGQMPLNIFEPRYLAMIDDSLRSRPPADRHDPARPRARRPATEKPALYSGRLCRPHHAVRRKWRRALSDPAHRRCALPHRGGAQRRHAYRQCRVTFPPFADDFIARKGEDEVDREALLTALSAFLKANNLKADWAGIESAPNEAAGQCAADDVALWRSREAGAAGGARSEDPRRNSRSPSPRSSSPRRTLRANRNSSNFFIGLSTRACAPHKLAIALSDIAGSIPMSTALCRPARRQRRPKAPGNSGLPADEGSARI